MLRFVVVKERTKTKKSQLPVQRCYNFAFKNTQTPPQPKTQVCWRNKEEQERKNRRCRCCCRRETADSVSIEGECSPLPAERVTKDRPEDESWCSGSKSTQELNIQPQGWRVSTYRQPIHPPTSIWSQRGLKRKFDLNIRAEKKMPVNNSNFLFPHKRTV